VLELVVRGPVSSVRSWPTEVEEPSNSEKGDHDDFLFFDKDDLRGIPEDSDGKEERVHSSS